MIYREELAHIHHQGFSEFAESAAPGVIEILRRHGLNGGVVVDAGCGTGILARALLGAGFAVHGFDASASMIALARETAPRAQFVVTSLDSFDLPRCDAIVAMGEVLNYAGFDATSTFVAASAGALRPGGVLLFDVAERDAYPERVEHRSGGDDWSVIATSERDGDALRRRILTFRQKGEAILRDDEVHTLALYDRSEMLTLLRSLGFAVKVLRSYGTRRLPRGHALYVAVRRKSSRAD